MPPGTYRNISGNLALAYGLVAAGAALRAAAVPRRLPDHAGLRHPARAEQAQAVRRAHLPGRGRDRRRSAPRSARPSAVRSASPRRPGPGVALKAETIGLAVVARAAAGRRRRAARRPVDRAADQDRAGRPAAGDVRPQRRGAGADRRAALARRTASTPRSRPPGSRSTYRTPVILLSDGYLANGSEPWRVPDVDDLPDLRVDVRHRAQPHRRRRHRRVLALPARPGDAGPAVGDPRHAGPRAPHRRHREGRRHRQHLLRPGQPRLHGPHPAGQGRRHRARRSRRSRSTTRPATRGCSCSAGARPTGRSAPPAGGSARTGMRRRAGPPAPPQPVPGQPRRGAAPLRPGARARR